MHCMHYVCPKLQKYYIRILFMVPIYAIESWLALRFKAQKIFLETAREAYEVRGAWWGGDDDDEDDEMMLTMMVVMRMMMTRL
jgi:hypothetical protein